MKRQVLHTVWCNIAGEAEGEIWNWSVLGVKRSILRKSSWTLPRFCIYENSNHKKATEVKHTWSLGRLPDNHLPYDIVSCVSEFVFVRLSGSYDDEYVVGSGDSTPPIGYFHEAREGVILALITWYENESVCRWNKINMDVGHMDMGLQTYLPLVELETLA